MSRAVNHYPPYYRRTKIKYLDSNPDNFDNLRRIIDGRLDQRTQWAFYKYFAKKCDEIKGTGKEIPCNIARKHVALAFLYFLLNNATHEKMKELTGISTSSWSRIYPWMLAQVDFLILI